MYSNIGSKIQGIFSVPVTPCGSTDPHVALVHSSCDCVALSVPGKGQD